jgi:hypothetical protein
MGRPRKNKDNEIFDNYSREEINYFKNLDHKEQEEIIKIEKDLNDKTQSKIPLRFKFLLLNTDINNKRAIINKIDELDRLSVFSGEYAKSVSYTHLTLPTKLL